MSDYIEREMKNMEKEFVKAWELHKKELETYIRHTSQIELCSYGKLVKLLFEIVINPDSKDGAYDVEHILEIDDGDYQGVKIFILHRDTYYPDIEDYVYVCAYYGSCSLCDTLLSILYMGDSIEWEDKIPTEEQTRGYMQLLLHLLQKTVKFKNYT